MTNFLTKPNQVLMAEAMATSYKLKVGDTLTLQYGPKKIIVTIAGLLHSTDDVTGASLQDLLMTDISTAQEVLGMVGRLSTIDLIIPDTPAGESLLKQITDSLPPSARIQLSTAKTSAVTQMTASFQLSLTALSLLAVVVGCS